MKEENGIYIYGSPDELGCAIYQIVCKREAGENEK